VYDFVEMQAKYEVCSGQWEYVCVMNGEENRRISTVRKE
jgi:hypothetical protein